jgi:hypothetical protein
MLMEIAREILIRYFVVTGTRLHTCLHETATSNFLTLLSSVPVFTK